MRKILSNVHLPNEVEVFPGIYERRYFLRDSLATIAAIVALRATPKRLLAQTPIESTGAAGVDGLAWDEFLKRSVPMAQQLIDDPAFSIDEYLYRIGSLATLGPLRRQAGQLVSAARREHVTQFSRIRQAFRPDPAPRLGTTSSLGRSPEG